MKRRPDRVWVEINLDHIIHNYHQIANFVGEKVKINAIIKADGYGHGAVETAKTLCEEGVDMLSTATLDEAILLRRKKITQPILVLGYVDCRRINEIIENDITISLFSYELAKKISTEASKHNKHIKVHVKVDTGMNRIGLHYSQPEKIIKALSFNNLIYEGIFTHFSMADNHDTSYTKTQYKRFLKIINILEEKGINIPIKHTCNSSGVLLHKDKHMNMVRPGIIIFGFYPSTYAKQESSLNLKEAMVFKSRIIEIKEVKKNQPVSYGGNYITTKDTKIATIACGYADGFSRVLSSKANIKINGQLAPIIGNICMDMCMVDITKISANESDEVILFDEQLTVEEMASLCNTLNYEIICKIGMRVPRVYLKNGKIVKIQNYLQ
ncbi:MAG: alanine racemase [Clostridiales bacterium]|nr:alanine racemase [Clostridiales bacterium]